MVITPKTIMKKIKDITEELESEHGKAVNAELAIDFEVFRKSYAKATTSRGVQKAKNQPINLSDQELESLMYEKIIKLKEKEMNKAVKELDFETAAILRDEIVVLKGKTDKVKE